MEVALAYLVVLVAGFFVLVVRPQRRQITAHRAMLAALAVGDRVVTSGGIYGTVRGLSDETAEVEVAAAVRLTVARAAIARRLEPVEPVADDDAA